MCGPKKSPWTSEPFKAGINASHVPKSLTSALLSSKQFLRRIQGSFYPFSGNKTVGI